MAVRLGDADPAVVLADRELEGVETIDVERELPALLAAASDRFEPVATAADAPALIVYTSGTTGPPKGALLAHRVLYGHLPGFELSHDFFPQPDDLIWSPADWAWMGGLFDVLMPGLYHGRPVLAFQTTKFDPELTFDLIPRLGVRNVFMPATALRMMAAHDGPALSLRTLASGGEMVGEETAAWCSERLGARLNEFYGQTEANLLIGNCKAWPAKPGSMGRAYPGHELRLVDGEMAVRVEGDPVVFLGDWRNEAATAEKVRDGWLHTGDLAEVDDEGYYRFVGRTDDLISSACIDRLEMLAFARPRAASARVASSHRIQQRGQRAAEPPKACAARRVGDAGGTKLLDRKSNSSAACRRRPASTIPHHHKEGFSGSAPTSGQVGIGRSTGSWGRFL